MNIVFLSNMQLVTRLNVALKQALYKIWVRVSKRLITFLNSGQLKPLWNEIL